MIPRKRLDIGWKDLLHGLGACLGADSPEEAERRVLRAWPRGEASLACLSVRSGFDALLRVLTFPAGSEILVSALTIRDMTRIVEEHGLVPVPVDLDPRTLAVRRESLERAVTPRTKAILVAHLFGSRMPMEPVIRFAQEHGLLVFEDCAQAFAGFEDLGHPRSDVVLLSFGSIKTATALGGGILCFNDPHLRHRVRLHQSHWPVRSRWSFLSRIAKYSLLTLLSYRPFYTLFVALCRLLGADHDRVIGQNVRGFPGDHFFRQIRHRPPAALLALLEHRLRTFDQDSIVRRQVAAQLAIDRMPFLRRPGDQAPDHTHWVFPVLHEDPEEILPALWKKGFDATRGASSLCVVEPPADRPDLDPAEARQAFRQLVYLPVYPGVSRRATERLAAALREAERAGQSARPSGGDAAQPSTAGR